VSDEYRRQEADLDDLYRDIIIDHYRHPRHKGHLSAPTACHEGLNPLCGDDYGGGAGGGDDQLADIAYTGSGCSISQSSASMLAESRGEQERGDARVLIGDFTAMMRGGVDPEGAGRSGSAVQVRKFPVRIKCATLAWHTLEEALRRPTYN
jgi:nitrogen fixation NifU-like protein